MASLTMRNLKPENAQAVDGLPGLSVPDASLPLPPAPATRAAQPARRQHGSKGAGRTPPGKGRAPALALPGGPPTAGPGPRDLPRVQGREIYRGSRAARSTAGPGPRDLLRVRNQEIYFGSGSSKSLWASSSILTSLNVTTLTFFTKRAGRYISHTQASCMTTSKKTSPLSEVRTFSSTWLVR